MPGVSCSHCSLTMETPAESGWLGCGSGCLYLNVLPKWDKELLRTLVYGFGYVQRNAWPSNFIPKSQTKSRTLRLLVTHFPKETLKCSVWNLINKFDQHIYGNIRWNWNKVVAANKIASKIMRWPTSAGKSSANCSTLQLVFDIHVAHSWMFHFVCGFVNRLTHRWTRCSIEGCNTNLMSPFSTTLFFYFSNLALKPCV